MNEDGELREVEFKSAADAWPIADDDAGRSDEYITVVYDVRDGTYSLTYHPMVCAVTTHHFTQHHAVLALRDVGYSFPQITALLNSSYSEAHVS